MFSVFFAPRLCAVTEPQRHGLACDIPLPPNTTFERTVAPYDGVEHSNFGQDLQYQVAHTSTDAIVAFYRQQLPDKGWKCVQTIGGIIVAVQGKRTLGIALAPTEGASDHITMTVDTSTFAREIDTSYC